MKKRPFPPVAYLMIAVVIVGCHGGGDGGGDAGPAPNLSGTLDSSFGTGGKAIFPVGDTVAAISVDGAGNAYAAGRAHDDFVVTKFDNAGRLATSFGVGGDAFIDIGGGSFDAAIAIVLDANGDMYVAGNTTSPTNLNSSAFVVAKIDRNGNLVTSFGTGGKVVVGVVDTSDDHATSLVRDRQGNLYVSGYRRVLATGASTIVVAKLDSNGRLAESFGQGGRLVVEIEGGSAKALASALDSKDNLYLAGASSNPPAFLVAKLDGNGHPGAGFGTGGTARVLSCAATEGARAIAVDQADNAYLVGDCSNPPTFDETTLFKLDANGALVTSYGNGGKKSDAFGAGSSSAAYALALDGNGNTFVAGMAPGANFIPGAGNDPRVNLCWDFALAKLDPAGNPVTSFGTNGVAKIDVGDHTDDHGLAVALDNDGHAYVAGVTAPACGLTVPFNLQSEVLRLFR